MFSFLTITEYLTNCFNCIFSNRLKPFIGELLVQQYLRTVTSKPFMHFVSIQKVQFLHPNALWLYCRYGQMQKDIIQHVQMCHFVKLYRSVIVSIYLIWCSSIKHYSSAEICCHYHGPILRQLYNLRFFDEVSSIFLIGRMQDKHKKWDSLKNRPYSVEFYEILFS